MKKGSVALVGAGCGDPEFLTLKALRLLKECEVLVYDSLVHDRIIGQSPAACEKIYVGKRYGKHSMGQDEINEILIQKARGQKKVVRLKGGDPYVFGRGGEEFLALQKAGISCFEVPGITSAIAVPAGAGIPVTHRNAARSVTILTGTTMENSGPDYETLSRLGGTLVILMGMHRLGEIAEGLMAAGMDADMPAAVIMEGSMPEQKSVQGRLGNIDRLVKEAGLTSPGVIVIGQTAAFSLTGSEEVQEKPLFGLRVGVTGTPGFAARLSAALTEAGAKPIDMAFMQVKTTQEPLPCLDTASWLVFTSPNGVRIFFGKMKEAHMDLRCLCGSQFAVIGPGTGSMLEEYGFYADYMPEIYDASHLARGLTEHLLSQGGLPAFGKVFLFRAANANPVLGETFARKGIPFEEFSLYELGTDVKRRGEMPQAEADYVVFGSAAGIRAWMEDETLPVPVKKYVCIGEQCARALAAAGNRDCLTADPYTVEGIIACLCREEEKGQGYKGLMPKKQSTGVKGICRDFED